MDKTGMMIEVSGLTKTYGPVTAVEDVTFTVGSREIIGFLGPNAAGKTTTMRILTGFLNPTRGTARVAGFDVARDPLEVKRRVGYLPETVPLYTEMTVRSFLRYVCEVKGMRGRAALTEVDRVTGRCGLEHMARRPIGHLSRGYRQRVGLAQALAGAPQLLILDEPTVGLDPSQVIEIRHLVRELGEDHTVLLSSHILREVEEVCHRVLIINRGRIVAHDDMARLTAGRGPLRFAVEASGAARTTIESVPGVASVTADGPEAWVVEARDDADPREAVVKALTAAGMPPRLVAPRARTLEDVFVDAISRDGGDRP
jgi:ABC-2 type transport system ATP-binding protein